MRMRKMQHIIGVSMLIMFATLLCASVISSAHAAAPAYEDSAITSKCDAIKTAIIAADLDKAYVVEYIVACTKTVVRDTFVVFLWNFYSLVSNIAKATLTLATVILGVMLVSGMVEKPSRDVFVFLFKMGCVLFFIQPTTVLDIFNMGLDSMDGLTDMMYNYSFFTSGGRCFDSATLWDRLDCTLDVLIGTVKDGGGSSIQGVSRGLMHFFASNIASTSLGAVIGMLGFYVTFTVLFAAIKSIHTYLAAIIALAFLLMLAPMFVPMIMFKQTRSYFDKWMRIAISFILQPVILFAFLSLMLVAMDTMMLTGSGSLLRVIDPNLDQPNKFMSEALETQGVFGVKTFERLFDPGDSSRHSLTAVEDGAMGRRAEDTRARSGDMAGAAAGYGVMATSWDKVQYDRLAHCGSAEDCQRKLAMITLTMALTAFVFISMLNYIPHLATDLTGGVYEVPNLFTMMGSQLPGGDMVQQQMQGATNKATEAMRGGVNNFREEMSRLIGGRS